MEYLFLDNFRIYAMYISAPEPKAGTNTVIHLGWASSPFLNNVGVN